MSFLKLLPSWFHPFPQLQQTANAHPLLENLRGSCCPLCWCHATLALQVCSPHCNHPGPPSSDSRSFCLLFLSPFYLCFFFFFLSWFLRFQLMCLSQRVLPWAVVTTHTYMVMLSCFHCLKLSCLHICSLIECLSPDPSLQVPLGQAPSLHEISVPRSLDQFWVQCVKSVKICTEWKKEGVNDHTWTLCWAPIKVCVDCVLL